MSRIGLGGVACTRARPGAVPPYVAALRRKGTLDVAFLLAGLLGNEGVYAAPALPCLHLVGKQ